MDEDRERLIRLEERLTSLTNDIRRISKKLDKVSSSVSAAEMLNTRTHISVSFGEKLLWAGVSGLVAFVVWLVEKTS